MSGRPPPSASPSSSSPPARQRPAVGDTAAIARVRPSAALVCNVVAQTAFGLLAMTICLPSMPQWGALFAASPSAVQATFSAFVVAYGALQLVYGPLSDRHGRRRVALIGLALAAAGSLLAAITGDIGTLIVARALQGAGSAAGVVAGRASVSDLFAPAQRTRVMAYVGMAMGLCPPLAIVVGGQLHAHFGWRSTFVAIAVLAALLFVAAWRGLPAPATRRPQPARWLPQMAQAYARLLRERAFVQVVGVLALTVGAFYAFLAGAPIVLRSYGVGPAQVGFYMMLIPLSYIGGNFATSRLAHRLGERRLMVLGQATTITGLVAMLALASAGLRDPLAFALPLMGLGIGHGLLVPACLARAAGSVPALAGSGVAVAGVVQQLTGAFGGYAVGWFDHDGPLALGGLMLGFTLAAGAVQVALLRRR